MASWLHVPASSLICILVLASDTNAFHKVRHGFHCGPTDILVSIASPKFTAAVSTVCQSYVPVTTITAATFTPTITVTIAKSTSATVTVTVAKRMLKVHRREQYALKAKPNPMDGFPTSISPELAKILPSACSCLGFTSIVTLATFTASPRTITATVSFTATMTVTQTQTTDRVTPSMKSSIPAQVLNMDGSRPFIANAPVLTSDNIPTQCSLSNLQLSPVFSRGWAVGRATQSFSYLSDAPGIEVATESDCCAMCYGIPGCVGYTYSNMELANPYGGCSDSGCPAYSYSSSCQIMVPQVSGSSAVDYQCSFTQDVALMHWKFPERVGATIGDFSIVGLGPCSSGSTVEVEDEQ